MFDLQIPVCRRLNIERKVKDILINKLRERALVAVIDEVEINEYPFCNDLPLVYLGEITNMCCLDSHSTHNRVRTLVWIVLFYE